MSEEKVSRRVVFILGFICTILAISLVVETGFYYLPEISSLNSQIDSLRSQIDDMRVAEVTTFVQGAVEYAKTNGKEIARAEFL